MYLGGNESMANILLVENEAVLAGLICNTLRVDGHQICEAGNSQAAIEIARNYQGTLDLVLTEVGLGTELAKVLKRQKQDTKIIFMTDYISVVDAIYSLLDGASVLEKPFTANKLRRTVHDTLFKATKRRSKSPRTSCRTTQVYQPAE